MGLSFDSALYYVMYYIVACFNAFIQTNNHNNSIYMITLIPDWSNTRLGNNSVDNW